MRESELLNRALPFNLAGTVACTGCGKRIFPHHMAADFVVRPGGIEIAPYYPIRCRHCYQRDEAQE